jgi:hypothetical protein
MSRRTTDLQGGSVKPEYFINKKEHVMTHGIFSQMTIYEVGRIIGGLSREKRAGKKSRKQQEEKA